MSRQYVSSGQFVTIYLNTHRNGGTIDDIAEATGMKRESVSPRASQLRQMGVNLPKLGQARKKLNIANLAKMVSDYEAEIALNLEGEADCTISDHLDEDVQNFDEVEHEDFDDLDEDVQNDEDNSGDEDEEVPGRGLVNAKF